MSGSGYHWQHHHHRASTFHFSNSLPIQHQPSLPQLLLQGPFYECQRWPIRHGGALRFTANQVQNITTGCIPPYLVSRKPMWPKSISPKSMTPDLVPRDRLLKSFPNVHHHQGYLDAGWNRGNDRPLPRALTLTEIRSQFKTRWIGQLGCYSSTVAAAWMKRTSAAPG